ncbi:F-box only protein 6 [Bombina bombina]|uniref:F-box only protein 6 n=1 Tax=Bombina bombina TaxID=8345 RepID=UPI00235A6F80|nr:F-box only protein 6 [Bombina bombina]XP_053547432.1 F-box only protein 6 [Bombina bombina]XP_053547434.1 F-box only protein 6 [Bombina bombina]XP_053547435.1 F-box only protein 6 [Bombina bombina]
MTEINHLPEDALLEILSLVPARDLILRCSRVCAYWKEIIDSPTLWIIKCQRAGYISKACKKSPSDWKKFYYICSVKRNLLRNPCAMEGMNCWTIERNGGDRWKIEDLPGEHGQHLPDEKVTQYFVTSYGMCKKSQLIALKKAGYGNRFMDAIQPAITVKDWFAPRRDCGSMYKLCVRLLSKKKQTIQEFLPEPVMMEQWSDAKWQTMTHTFRDYGPGVRYIYFQHGGQDTQFWAGWYGVRVTNSSVTIEPEDLSE